MCIKIIRKTSRCNNPDFLTRQETLALSLHAICTSAKKSRIYDSATKNTDCASRRKKPHAAHTVPKSETDHLHVQEDLNSTIYAHALINLNSTHDQRSIHCTQRVYFAGMFKCGIFPFFSFFI